VIDFGIARGTQNTVLTLADRVVGSPDFMSPEQTLGRDIGPASDMFSLGGVLVFAATGLPPFYGGMTTMAPAVPRHDDTRPGRGSAGPTADVQARTRCVAGFISTGTGHVTIEAAATG
jgi:serine/threonine protein kinase